MLIMLVLFLEIHETIFIDCVAFCKENELDQLLLSHPVCFNCVSMVVSIPQLLV